TTSQKNADFDAVTSRLEVLVASIKRRSQHLYKDTNGSKGELWGLNEEGIKGLRSLTLKKKQAVTTMMKHARDCYAQVLKGTSMDFQRDWDGYGSDSEMSDE
ncbi:unnamed protein product, partial [Boreogadus saida]